MIPGFIQIEFRFRFLLDLSMKIFFIPLREKEREKKREKGEERPIRKLIKLRWQLNIMDYAMNQVEIP